MKMDKLSFSTTSFYTLKSKIDEFYQNAGQKDFRNVIIDKNARASRITLENSLIIGSSSGKIRIHDHHEVAPWLNARREEHKLQFLRRGRQVDGNYELNGILHNPGIPLNPVQTPLFIRAEGAELDFVSQSYAKAVDRTNIRKYKNATITLNDCFFAVEKVLVDIDPSFTEKPPEEPNTGGNAGWIAGAGCASVVLPVVSWIFTVPTIVGNSIAIGIKKKEHAEEMQSYRRRRNQNKRGMLQLSFCGHLAKKPLGREYY